MIESLGSLANPEATLEQYLGTPHLVQFEFLHERPYSGESPLLLTVFCETPGISCVITPSSHEVTAAASGCTSLLDISSRLDVPSLDLTSPLRLSPLAINKPWGREIWYTGIEQRGVCTFEGVPLPWVLDCFPSTISGDSYNAPILLKVLEPSSDGPRGDLYFEVHEAKNEVYVVTDVDRRAWPDGVGKIRFGFDRSKRDEYRSSDEFKRAYLAAVRKYQGVRDTIDRLPDEPDVSTPERDELTGMEHSYRLEMDSFTSLRDLTVGDVVQVPPLTPHALQHGVTVVEFQTPHYERLILSFAQKVLTQSHWDTEKALPLVDLETDAPLRVGTSDLIADFKAFTVRRITLAPGERSTLNDGGYVIAMGIVGDVRIGKTGIAPGSAYFVPAAYQGQVENPGPTQSVTLLAMSTGPDSHLGG